MLEWDDLRIFLAIARGGTLSAAARALRITQPTAGRRLAALEAKLGARLVDRTPSSLVLTRAGREMMAHAGRMEAEALAAERLTRGRDAGYEGAVRVTASEWLVVRVLSPGLASIARAHPRITIELISDTRHLNLPRREADLAIRPRRFDDAAVVERRVGHLEFSLYAARRYLAERGAPAMGCKDHALIAMDDDVGDAARGWLGEVASEAHVVARTNGREPMAAMAAAGLGLTCLPTVLGDAVPELERVPMRTAPPKPALFLGVHREVRKVPRVQVVARALAEVLRARCA